MPPAATVDFQVPSNFSFDSVNAPANGSSGDSGSFKAGSSFSAGGRPGPAPSTRTKARLFKQRRSSKASSSTASAAVDSGINPFRSVNSHNVHASGSCNDNQFGKNVGFVFGSEEVDNCAGEANVGLDSGKLGSVGNGFRDSEIVDLGNTISLRNEDFSYNDNVGKPRFGENTRAEGTTFTFGAAAKDQVGNKNVKSGETVSGAELLNGMKKLNIEQVKMGNVPVETVQVSNETDIPKDRESFFVFKSGEKNSDVPPECSIPMKKGEEIATNSTDLDGKQDSVNARKTGGFSLQSVNENIFVFGSSGNSIKHGAYSSQSSTCPPEVGVKGDVLSSSCSLSSLGAQGDKEIPEAGSMSRESRADHSSTSFFGSAEFKLPDFDSSASFSEILHNGSDSKECGLRTRVSKDKHLKKTKAKSRQPRPTRKQPLQRPLSCQSISQEEETPGCYSPMDFSPYEETSTNNDVPLSGHQTTDQTNVTSGNSSSTCAKSQPNLVFLSSGLGVTSTDLNAGVASTTSGQDGNMAQFCFSSNVASTVGEKFAFTASTSTQDHASSVKRLHKKKYRLKTPNASVTHGSSLGSTPLSSKLQGSDGNFLASEKKGKPQNEEQEQGCESALSAAEKACDKWRRRGNEAYEKGELSKAENFYTWGVNCIPPGDELSAAFRPLVRCYSNRAATRMVLGRVREAIKDCLMAVEMDPTFHRAHMRAANCYLLLGESEEAMQCFNQLMDSTNVICLDRQVAISAAQGIQKSQKVIEHMDRSAELLKLRTSDAAASALELISEAMTISLYSEKLLEMKAEALCLLGKHEDVIALCQQSLDFAEKNFSSTSSGKHVADSSYMDVRQWRNHISSKCYFHLGRLEVALDLVEKKEFANKTQESPYPLAVTIHELLKQKGAGNTAFQSGKHAEAVEHYTSAILSSMESRPFAAICFCNRAAAHQALGQIADAIADCSLAIALDEKYAKAVSRRATLYEMIRDYKQAAADLQRLVSLLEKQSSEKSKQRGSGNNELRQVRQRLSLMEEEAKGDVPLDLYLILGVKKTDPASEIKKAYRKAALRHHPDKAGQCLVRTDAGDEGRPWKDIAESVHKDSDRLFKMIGEAYAVLSDPTKREEYDLEEDMRRALKEANGHRSTSRRHSEYFYPGYPFERSSNRRSWQDSCRTNSHRRW